MTNLYPDDGTAMRAVASSALDAAQAPAGGPRPWGAPDLDADGLARWTKVIDQLLEKIGALLDVAQAAHRGADLAPDDIVEMQRLETWYARLQVERERLQPPAPPAP